MPSPRDKELLLVPSNARIIHLLDTAMGLGVLEDHKLDHVPGTLSCYIGLHNDANLNTGTSYVNENPELQPQPDQRPWLKYDRSGPVPILLIPQPSDDPYDPLVCSLH